MTNFADKATPTFELAPGEPVVLPLKADRIQLTIVLVDAGNRPYDFSAETAAERDARLEAGWRKRTVDAPRRTRSAA